MYALNWLEIPFEIIARKAFYKINKIGIALSTPEVKGVTAGQPIWSEFYPEGKAPTVVGHKQTAVRRQNKSE